MADITVASDVHAANEFSVAGANSHLIVDVSSTVIYRFYRQVTSVFLVYVKSTDGGQTWGSPVDVIATANSSAGIHFDKWTSGDTGTKIHIGITTASLLRYVSLDTATDTLSTPLTIASSLSTTGTNSNGLQITKDRGGYLYIAVSCNAAAYEAFWRSVDDGANWTSRTSPWEGVDNDAPNARLVPANAADTHDLWMLYGDSSASEWSIKTYDDSADTWSEQTITLTNTFIPTINHRRQCDAVIRHSDGHMIIAIVTVIDGSTGDLVVLDYDGTTITQKTDIITNTDDIACPTLYLNQNNDEIFVGWLGNPAGTDVWQVTITVWCARSTDGGTTWGTSTQYSQDAAADFRGLSSSHSSPGNADGRFMLSWFDDDALDIITNYANSVAISPAVAALIFLPPALPPAMLAR